MPDLTDPALMPAELLLAHYRRGTLSPVEALQAVIERIARFNPRLNAFAVMNPQALEAAGQSAARWRAGRPLGLLDGVPCTVKDLLDLSGFPTRRGSRLTSPEPVSEDAPAVTALKNAGAVIVGKTTTTEYGWKTPGDSPLHGITRNPWNPARTPGGSSCGAGAAGAACFGPLHIGTDAGGSVRLPAAWCGLVGLKPSFGRIPQWPLGAFANVACAGPMTRTVGDCALMLSVLAQFDRRDPFCLPDDGRDWRDTLSQGVQGLRIGVLRQPGFDAPADGDSIAAVEEAAQILVDAGAELEMASADLPNICAVFGRVWGVALSRLVASIPEGDRGKLDPGLLEVAAQEGGMLATDFVAAETLRIQVAHAMARLHAQYDLVLSPTVAKGAPLADAPTLDPVCALWTEWAPWTGPVQPVAPARDYGADESGCGRDAAVGATCRPTLPRRPGLARRMGDRAGRGVCSRGVGLAPAATAATRPPASAAEPAAAKPTAAAVEPTAAKSTAAAAEPAATTTKATTTKATAAVSAETAAEPTAVAASEIAAVATAVETAIAAVISADGAKVADVAIIRPIEPARIGTQHVGRIVGRVCAGIAIPAGHAISAIRTVNAGR
ncbi:amidase family protein [Acidisphaera sp. L21]|uniref:amidase family protein n=1 Tax=Acidisphaera sp. L21 TaxID=1641851 RepID=UPI0020B1213D|nr:amidase family protein [Acidisphaera sp. L21]